MMFGLPAACLAMYHEARPERHKAVGGMLFSLAFTSFLTGVTEPIEFTFMFVAPLALCHPRAAHRRFDGADERARRQARLRFSAGLFDYVLNFSLATRPWMLLPIGAVYARDSITACSASSSADSTLRRRGAKRRGRRSGHRVGGRRARGRFRRSARRRGQSGERRRLHHASAPDRRRPAGYRRCRAHRRSARAGLFARRKMRRRSCSGRLPIWWLMEDARSDGRRGRSVVAERKDAAPAMLSAGRGSGSTANIVGARLHCAARRAGRRGARLISKTSAASSVPQSRSAMSCTCSSNPRPQPP